ncbi:PstS family phosphate ABC transporter substrate-binding protein [Desulfitobacterium sp. PCE1]|uniref:PstS family phosphate ABC transporter substrate-binding protein n=1 Tax=Desulfitobacterium sp. PCE1 TaxID=146907 RepID=UPI000366AA4F|nr:substrate-binding domain-containing protein [Desulfitobacterium sp. PCE1]
MASSKRYIFKTLLNQMMTVPILFTTFYLLLFFSGLNFISEGRGDDTVYLIYVLLAFIGSFLIGGIVGFLHSRFAQNKPESPKARYFSAVFPILYTLIFIMMLLMITQGNIHSSWWSWTVVKNPLYFPLGFVLFMWGNQAAFIVGDLMGYIGFAAGFLLEEIFSKKSRKAEAVPQRKGINIGLAVLCLSGVLISGGLAKDVLANGWIEIRYGESTLGSELTEFDLISIAPFKENNGLAHLDQATSLQFTELETMPRLDGATAVYPVYGAFVEAVYQGLGEYYRESARENDLKWEKDFELAFVQSEEFPLNIVQCSKTNRAYERLMAGETDIIFVAEPSQAHQEQIKAQGDEFVLTPIASEAFVFFTNAENPVESLTLQQIQGIYAGEIKNWKEVGGANRKILAFQRPENSGSQTVMQNRVMQGQTMVEPTRESYAGGMGEIISRVADYKNAKNSLGYSFLYYSSEMVKNNQIKYLAVDGVLPTPETVRNAAYPFTVPVYAVTLKSNTQENVGRFIQWVLSEEGQSLIEKTGYIPLEP